MKISKSLSCNSLRLITLLVLSSVSFSSFTVNAQPDSKTTNGDKEKIIINAAYKEALTDSIKTEPDEITNNLTIINNPKANPNLSLDTQGRVLVVHFTDTPNFKPLNGTWVTVAPKLKSFCTNYKIQNPDIQTAQINQGIKQILGITPESKATYSVEIWVAPEWLKRPAILADIKNVKISNPDSLDSSKNKGDSFLAWLNERLKARKDLQKKINLPASKLVEEYPWTGLGYTFNWASKLDPSIKEFGLSEFVIWETKEQISSSGKVPAVEVNRSFTTEEYCKPDNFL
jgi:hypothetical protein